MGRVVAPASAVVVGYPLPYALAITHNYTLVFAPLQGIAHPIRGVRIYISAVVGY